MADTNTHNQQIQPVASPHAPNNGSATPLDQTSQIMQAMNAQHAMIVGGLNTGRILVEDEDPLTGSATVHIVGDRQLRTRFANESIPLGNTTQNAFDLWLRHPHRRNVKGIVFAPGQDVPDYYNLWQGFTVAPQEGDCSLFLQHIRDVIAAGDETVYHYIIHWLADAVQHLSQPPGVALVLRGRQGTGKSLFGAIFGALYGPHFKHLTERDHLIGKHNDHLKDAAFVLADEATWGGNAREAGVLKGLITEKVRWIEPKNVNAYCVSNYIRLVVASNESWPVPAAFHERRFCVLDVADDHIATPEAAKTYFDTLLAQMRPNAGKAALLHYLLHVDLSNVNLRDFPKSRALLETKILSMKPAEQFWYDRLRNGSLYAGRPGWDADILCEFLHDEYAKFTQRTRDRGTETELGLALKKLLPAGFDKRELTQSGSPALYYIIPSLPACREHFEKQLGMPVPWEQGV